MSYYCRKCQEFVIPISGQFFHPHLGIKTAYLCPKCGTMVYPKERERELV